MSIFDEIVEGTPQSPIKDGDKKPERTPFDMPKDMQPDSYFAGAKKKVQEVGAGIVSLAKKVPQLPGIVREAVTVDNTKNFLAKMEETLVARTGEQKQKIEAGKLPYTQEQINQTADLVALGLGGAGYLSSRVSKGIGMRFRGSSKEEVGAEITGDTMTYAALKLMYLGFKKAIVKNERVRVADAKSVRNFMKDQPTVEGRNPILEAFPDAETKGIYIKETAFRKWIQPVREKFMKGKSRITKFVDEAGKVVEERLATPKFEVSKKAGIGQKTLPEKPAFDVGGKGPKLFPEIKGKPAIKPKTAPLIKLKKAPSLPKSQDEIPVEKPSEGAIGIVPESFQDYEKTITTLKAGIKKVSATFDVEKPFRDAKAPETGLAIKALPSKMAVGEERALDFAKKINKMGLDKKELGNLAFMAEKSIPTSPKAQEAVDFIRKELDTDLIILKKRGVLKSGFPESAIERLELEKGGLKKQSDITAIDKKIARLKEIDYMPIQLKILMEDVINERLAKGESLKDLPAFGEGKLASFARIKGRKSVTLKDLVDSGLVPKEKADARVLIASYKRYIYNKLAEKDIIDNVIKEKLAVPAGIAPDNFVEIPTRYAQGLKDYKVDPVLADYLSDTLGAIHSKSNPIAKAASVVKMLQFYNPLFLPLNDVVQAAMLGSLETPNLPRYFKQAVEMSVNRTPEYYEALEHGLASTPHKNPFKVFRRDLDKVIAEKDSIPARIITNLKRYGKTGGIDAIGDLYSTSWNVAWKLDRMVRLVSYNYLRDHDYSARDAAQIAAAFHGDYAGVPAKTRRALNQVLFTPTFKIAMSKLYGSMLKGAANAGGGPNATPKNKAFAKGLLWTAAIIMGRRLFMKKLGFKEEEFNRKYSLEIDTSSGKKKLTMSFADPTNIPSRYYYRFLKPRAEDLNIPSRIWQGVTYELNPMWRMAINFKENRKFSGEQIYKPFDDREDQIKDITQWVITETVGILKPFLKKKTKKDRLLAEGIKKSAYPLLLNAMKIYTFQYAGDLDIERNVKALGRLQRNYIYNEKNYFMEGDTKGFKNRLKNYKNKVEELMRRF